MPTILETERLILRTWQDSDLQPMLTINQDPKVMEFFPKLQNLENTKKLIQKFKDHYNQHSYTCYPTIKKDTQEFIGFIGLLNTNFDAHFTPATEIGWRLSSNHWNQGYATEGAKAVLHHAFTKLSLPEIISFTAQTNAKSIKVMQKIGLHYNTSDDFDSPKIDDNSPLKKHVLFRLTRDKYLSSKA